MGDGRAAVSLYIACPCTSLNSRVPPSRRLDAGFLHDLVQTERSFSYAVFRVDVDSRAAPVNFPSGGAFGTIWRSPALLKEVHLGIGAAIVLSSAFACAK